MREDLETLLVFLHWGGGGRLGFGQLEESFVLRHQLIIIVIIIQTLNPIIILFNLRLLLLFNNNIFVFAVVLLLFSLFLCCWRPRGREGRRRPRWLGLSLARGDARPQGGRGRVRGEGGEALLRGRGTIRTVLVTLVLVLFIMLLIVAFLVRLERTLGVGNIVPEP